MRTKIITTTAVATFIGLTAGSVQAQDFPSKGPVKLVVGFAPGGGTDAIARALNTKLSEILKQTVVVENKAGAGGTLSTDFVAKSAPDGYTISFTLNNHAINQALYANLPFDTERDLRGVALIGSLTQLFASNPSAPAKTLQEFLAQAKGTDARNKTYASGGVGSPGHFAAAYLEFLAKAQLTHVPYRGAGPAIADVVGNHVPYILSTLSGLLSNVKAGKLHPIAVTSKERSPLLPNVPTIAESGFPGYDMDTWIAMFVPRQTPDAVVDILYKATMEAVKAPDVQDRITSQAGIVRTGTPAQLDALVKTEIAQFTKIVKDSNIKPE